MLENPISGNESSVTPKSISSAVPSISDELRQPIPVSRSFSAVGADARSIYKRQKLDRFFISHPVKQTLKPHRLVLYGLAVPWSNRNWFHAKIILVCAKRDNSLFPAAQAGSDTFIPITAKHIPHPICMHPVSKDCKRRKGKHLPPLSRWIISQDCRDIRIHN